MGTFVVACHKQNVISIIVLIDQVTAHQAMCILDFVFFSMVSCELSEVRHSWCLAKGTAGKLVEEKTILTGNLLTRFCKSALY